MAFLSLALLTRAAFLFVILCGCLCVHGAVCPVKPGAFHEATFRARIVAGPSLEAHPQLSDLVPMAAGRPDISDVRFPYVAWTFREKKGGPAIPRPFEGSAPLTLYSSSWRTFIYRFYAPENATCVEFEVFPGLEGSRAEMGDVSVRELPAPSNLVAHPGFDDLYAPLGWSLGGGTLYLTDVEGRPFAMAEGWAGGPAVTDLFPVKPGSRIVVSVKGSSARYDVSRPQMRCTLAFAPSFAAAAEKSGLKAAGTVLGIKGKGVSASHPYAVPDGMHWARLEFRHGAVEYAEVRAEGCQ